MRAKQSALVLLKKSASDKIIEPTFETNEVVLQSGIYRVWHSKHHLPLEVTLLKDQQFPRCAKCQSAVVFELVRGVTFTEESLQQYPQIRLYELPVLEDEKVIAA